MNTTRKNRYFLRDGYATKPREVTKDEYIAARQEVGLGPELENFKRRGRLGFLESDQPMNTKPTEQDTERACQLVRRFVNMKWESHEHDKTLVGLIAAALRDERERTIAVIEIDCER